MTRTVDHDTRRKAVLAATINKYIQTAEPIASEDLANEFEVSSATIRNIFAELEDGGYLTHPYTSAGRIPTAKGYRYYVDFLLSEMELITEEKERIVNQYHGGVYGVEDILERTSELISDITHYAGIVSILESQQRLIYNGVSHIFEQPEFQNVNQMRLLMRMIEDKRQLLDIINREFTETVKVYIGSELECIEMTNCSLAVSHYSFKDKPIGKLAVLGPSRMEYKRIMSALEYVSVVLTDALARI